MLIQFKFENFRSYRKESTFLMSRVKAFKEHEDTHLIFTDRGLDLLKVSGIYGSNGGGKSNLIGAFANMLDTVHNSFRESLLKEKTNLRRYDPFLLNSSTEHAESRFEVSFIEGGVLYRYGFALKGEEVTSEWLYRKAEREIQLFRREGQKFEINKESFNEGERFKKEVNPNVLMLSHLAQHNQPVSTTIFGWFSRINVVTGLHSHFYRGITTSLLQKDQKFKSWLKRAIKFLEITDVEVGEDQGLLYTYHSRYDADNLLVDSVRFPLDMEESEGTKKLVYLLGPIYYTLASGKILFIDEFDTKLHSNLSRKLVELMNVANKKGAQFVFTAQDTSLMDKDLFRRDQIWFASKNQFGESELYSLSDFNSSTVRSTSDYQKKYLAHDFGAADTMDLTEDLLTVSDGQE